MDAGPQEESSAYWETGGLMAEKEQIAEQVAGAFAVIKAAEPEATKVIERWTWALCKGLDDYRKEIEAGKQVCSNALAEIRRLTDRINTLELREYDCFRTGFRLRQDRPQSECLADEERYIKPVFKLWRDGD